MSFKDLSKFQDSQVKKNEKTGERTQPAENAKLPSEASSGAADTNKPVAKE